MNHVIDVHILRWLFPLQTINCFSNMVNICLFQMPYFTLILRWKNYFQIEACKHYLQKLFDIKKIRHLILPPNLVEKQKSVFRCRKKGISLPLSTTEHCLAKAKLNNSIFSLKFVTTLFLWEIGGKQGIFYYYGKTLVLTNMF